MASNFILNSLMFTLKPNVGHHSVVLPKSTISVGASTSFFGLLGTMLSELLTGQSMQISVQHFVLIQGYA
nr:hypothetical protein CFP56_23186 [Quercus suber]